MTIAPWAMVLAPVIGERAQRRRERERFAAPKRDLQGKLANTGRRGTEIVWDGIRYPSWETCARATGLKKTQLRWKLERR